MKKTFTKLFAALALLAFFIPSMIAVGQTRAGFEFNLDQLYQNGTLVTAKTVITTNGGTLEFTNQNEDFTILLTRNSGNQPGFYTSSGYIRFYSSDTFKLSAADGITITKIVVTPNGSSFSVNDMTGLNASTKTWEGSASEVTFTGAGTNKWDKLTITYTTGGGSTVATPQISGTDNKDYFVNSTTVTITCDTEQAQIQYSYDNTNWTNYSEPFEISSTCTVYAKATKSGMAESTADKEFTKLEMKTISQARTQASGPVYTQGIVTSISGSSAYIQDDNAAINVYGQSDLTVGTKYTVVGVLSVFNGLLEITNPVCAETTGGSAISPTVMTIAEINASTNQGWYVRIESATVTAISGSGASQNTTITQDNNSIVVRGDLGVTVAVNDVVSLDGNIGNYNAIQIANPQNVTVQQNTNPVINADNVTLEDVATSGSIAYTIDNPTGQTLSASITSGNEGNWLTLGAVSESAVALSCTANETNSNRTAAVTLSYQGATPLSVTVTQEKYFEPAGLPFAFDGGRADVADKTGLKQDNLGSDYKSSPKLKFDNGNNTSSVLVLKINERPGTLSFKVKGNPGGNPSVWAGTFQVLTSANGTSWSVLASYDDLTSTVTTKTIENIDADVRYFKWVYSKTSGNVALGDINLAKYVAPTGNTITAGTLTNVAIYELWDGDTFESINLNEEVAANTTVYFSLIVDNGYTLESVSVLDSNSDEVELTEATGSWYFTMPNSSVTINATATATPTPVITGDIYVKVTSTDDLTSGQYLIVYEDGNLAFNGSLSTLDAVGNTISVTCYNNKIQANSTTTAAEFTINTTNSTIKSASGYYIGQTSDANGLLSSTETVYTNTISFGEGNANIVSSGGAYLRYNSTSNQNRFRYFKSTTYTGQEAIQLYKRVYALSINGYGDNDEVKTGWNLIASPVSVNPSEVGNMTSDKFDLYRFNGDPSTAHKEWENWKQQDVNHYHFNLATGKGYLYAHNTDVDLLFTGEMATSIADVDLPYDAESNIKSLYLAGNSLQDATTFYVYNGDIEKQNVNFLTINGDGSGFITTTATSFTAQAMQGFFVQSGGEDWTLSTTDMDAKKGNNGLLNIKINRDRGTLIDNAIVSFDKAPQMKKFHLFDNTTSVFIPQNGEEMSVVRTEAHGTMPVNFKAKEMGRYTISVETEGIDMSYLHLIDRLTGEDVNLLLDNEYSFIASNNDSEERFILSFTEKGYDAHGNEIFVYQSGNDLIVNGEGELQIFDVMGRMVKNTVINGVEAIAMPQGVYIFRLNENIQKIVVR